MKIVAPRIIPALAGNTKLSAQKARSPRDHPRSRGEYPLLRDAITAVAGSSPLSRGIHVTDYDFIRARRIIPALAGNTGAASRDQAKAWDHPRSRGEYPRCYRTSDHSAGSSPLSRGIRLFIPPGRVRNRIIPALAGNTGCGVVFRHPHGDHPRSRGEYSPSTTPTYRSWGSSPLSRGIRSWCCFPSVGLGIIPALAGNTKQPCRACPPRGDHPRSRGEYYGLSADGAGVFGSSPLSRGIPCRARLGLSVPGIIPALAGNTSSPSSPTTTSADHPRSRGEYLTGPSGDWVGVGSSPLSRGIRATIPARTGRGGIIPALAGNTLASAWLCFLRRDHPRSRGEYCSHSPYKDHEQGSSPLSRGILRQRHQQVRQHGIIPALAGNTRMGMADWSLWRDHPRSRGEYARSRASQDL